MDKIFLDVKPISKIIKERKSVRTYNGESIEDYKIEKLNEFINTIKSPFNNKMRIEFIYCKNGINSKSLGTYGIIRGTNYFISIIGKENDTLLQEIGYRGQLISLYAEKLGLSTCWIGGSFNKANFSQRLKIQEDEIFPAIMSIGYESKRKSLADLAITYLAKPKKRKEWSELFYLKDFSTPLTEYNNLGIFKNVLEAVRLAPSASNKQPWRVVKNSGNYHFYINRTKGYGEKLGFDIQKIDMGIALSHFYLVCMELDLKGEFKVVDPNIDNKENDNEYIISWINRA